MSGPKRIQRRRVRGWRMPKGAVAVSRPGKWGNPISLSEVSGQYPSLAFEAVARLVVRDFEVLARRGTLSFPNWRFLGGRHGPVEWTYPSVAEIRAGLAGRDLACWCSLADPCHADVLLQIANEEVTDGRA